MVTKFWSKQLLMIKPDPSPYLMASNRYRLYAGAGTPLYWTNNAQVRVNTLDNKSLGSQAFSVSFAVTREFVILSTGTRYILSYPGLMDVKAEDGTLWFKFNWEARPVWKYISSSELVPGWNNVSLEANGSSIITLAVNDTSYTLVDASKLPTYDWFSGFSDSSYITTCSILSHYDELGNTTDINGYTHTTKIRLTALGVANQGIMDTGMLNSSGSAYLNSIRWTITTDGVIHYRISSNGEQTYIVDIIGKKLPLNTDILCKAAYNKTTGYAVGHSVDGGNTWVVDGASTVTTPPYTPSKYGWTPVLGDNAATGLSLQGSIDLANTVYICNGKVEFNGATAKGGDSTKDNGYFASGKLTEDTDRQVYPSSITTGKLVVYQPWTLLKDIEAQLLDTPEPPTPVDPPSPTKIISYAYRVIQPGDGEVLTVYSNASNVRQGVQTDFWYDKYLKSPYAYTTAYTNSSGYLPFMQYSNMSNKVQGGVYPEPGLPISE